MSAAYLESLRDAARRRRPIRLGCVARLSRFPLVERRARRHLCARFVGRGLSGPARSLHDAQRCRARADRWHGRGPDPAKNRRRCPFPPPTGTRGPGNPSVSAPITQRCWISTGRRSRRASERGRRGRLPARRPAARSSTVLADPRCRCWAILRFASSSGRIHEHESKDGSASAVPEPGCRGCASARFARAHPQDPPSRPYPRAAFAQRRQADRRRRSPRSCFRPITGAPISTTPISISSSATPCRRPLSALSEQVRRALPVQRERRPRARPRSGRQGACVNRALRRDAAPTFARCSSAICMRPTRAIRRRRAFPRCCSAIRAASR